MWIDARNWLSRAAGKSVVKSRKLSPLVGTLRSAPWRFTPGVPRSLLSERWPPPQKLNQQCQKWTHSQTPFSAVVDLNCLFRPALKARAHSREPREDRRNWIRSTKWNKTLYHRRCRGPNSYIHWLAETMCTAWNTACAAGPSCLQS